MKFYTGIVQHGSKRAESLGYATLNIPLEDPSVSGVYAAKVKIEANPAEPDARPEGFREYRAAAFADSERKILEAHLLGFFGDLYDKKVTIELHKKIRESKKFENDVQLREAIASDVKAVREYFHL